MVKEKKNIIVLLSVITFMLLIAVIYVVVNKSKTSYVCPSSYKLYKDNICITEKEMDDRIYSCLEGRLDGNTHECVIKEEVKAKLTCNQNEALDKEECLASKTIMAEEVVTCPKGTIDVQMTEYCGKNPKSTIGSYVCPSGTYSKTKQGVTYCYKKKRSYNPPMVTCGGSNDTYLETDTATCYYEGSKAPQVPSCSHLSGAHLFDGKCYELVMKDFDYKCPEGYNQDNNKCYQYQRTKANKTCSLGYKLEENKCVKETRKPAQELHECKADNLIEIAGKCYGKSIAKKK